MGHFQVSESFLGHFGSFVANFRANDSAHGRRACDNADEITLGHLGSFWDHLRSFKVILVN